MMALKLLCALSWWISTVVAQGGSQLAPSVLKPPGIYMEAVAPTPRRLSVVMDTAAVRIAMADWCADPTTAEVTHGHISAWDVSGVADMAWLITTYCGTGGVIERGTFNEDLSGWDVSAVTTVVNMFRDAYAFNQSLSDWDVSAVTIMEGMFHWCISFNQPLSEWDVSSVTNMYTMFYKATSFNQPLSGWDVSAVTTMRNMFLRASSFNQPLSGWDVSSVTNMDYMFYAASSFNHVLCWDVTGKATSQMFDQSLGSVNGACTQCVANEYRVDTTTCAACAAGSFSSPTAGSTGADSCSAIMPTSAPTLTLVPTPAPTLLPTAEPTLTLVPTPAPTLSPTAEPTLTLVPTPAPTLSPTLNPTPSPTAEPTPQPTPLPTAEPTHEPTVSFSPTNTFSPSMMPTPGPSQEPTLGPVPGPVGESGTPAKAVANGSDGDDGNSNSKVTYASLSEFLFWLFVALLVLLLFLGVGLLLHVKAQSRQKKGHNGDAEEGLALSDNLGNSAPATLDQRTTKELPKSFSSMSAFADGSDENDGRGGSLDRQPPSGGGSGGDGIKI